MQKTTDATPPPIAASRQRSPARPWRTLALLPALLAAGCLPLHVTRAPGAFGRIVDADTGRPLWQASVHRWGRDPVPAETNAPARVVNAFRFQDKGAAWVYSSRQGEFLLHPVSVLELEGFLPATRIVRPESVSATFDLTAPGYVTNRVEVTASRTNHWRVNLGTVELSLENPPKSAGQKDCDCQ